MVVANALQMLNIMQTWLLVLEMQINVLSMSYFFKTIFFSVIKYVKTLKKIFSTTDGDVFVLPIYLMMEFLYLV